MSKLFNINLFKIQDIKKKTRKCNDLTNTIYKQPYDLYLKTIEYKKCFTKEENIDNNQSSEPLNTSIPMDCPDTIYLKPEVCFMY